MVTSKQMRLGRAASQMAVAVPQVIAHRVGRMMGAGPLPSGRDQQEFQESWAAMSWQAMAAQQQFALWWTQTWWKVALGGWMNPPSWQHLSAGAHQRLLASMVDVAHHGMAPVHRRAVANARRLGRAAR